MALGSRRVCWAQGPLPCLRVGRLSCAAGPLHVEVAMENKEVAEARPQAPFRFPQTSLPPSGGEAEAE